MHEERPHFRGRFRRLPPRAYRGLAWVHWTMNVESRATGWLDGLHHARLREALCHALARERLVCAAYCLMPDHGHFLVGGLDAGSDQRPAMKVFRRAWNGLLGERARPLSLAHQAHDHVLTEEERGKEEFENVRGYILENPRRGGLVESWRDWSWSGCLVVGYPDLDPRQDGFHERFWKIYYRSIGEGAA